MVYLSTDNGNTWSSFSFFSTSYVCRFIAINPENGDIFAGTSDNLYRSTNNGNDWVYVLNSVPNDILFTQFGEIYLGVGGIYGGVRYSTDMGSTWINKNSGLPDSYIYCLLQGTDGTLYAGTSGRGIYRSTNGGNNWMISSNYRNTMIGRLIIASDGSIFVAAYADGILKSTDKGITWNQVNTGLSSGYNAQKIIYNPRTGYIFVSGANSNYGVYRSTDLGTK